MVWPMSREAMREINRNADQLKRDREKRERSIAAREAARKEAARRARPWWMKNAKRQRQL